MPVHEHPESPLNWTRRIFSPAPADGSDEPTLGYECALPYLSHTPWTNGDSPAPWSAVAGG